MRVIAHCHVTCIPGLPWTALPVGEKTQGGLSTTKKPPSYNFIWPHWASSIWYLRYNRLMLDWQSPTITLLEMCNSYQSYLFDRIWHSYSDAWFSNSKSILSWGIVQLERVGYWAMIATEDQNSFLGCSGVYEVVSEFPCQLFLQTSQIGKELSVWESRLLKSLC